MKIKIVLILIIILAAVLRLWNLNNFPAGLNADEAAIGYNAFSLFQTGKDEYGTPWPLTFKSFGDFKPGLYFYTVIPFVAMFDLNEWAVRLPSAIFGILTVFLIYFLGKEIFKNRLVGLLSSFLLAISPWHLHYSRGGWETNMATFFITLGVYLFIKGKNNYQILLWSIISFLISMYTYQSPRLIIPVLVVCLLVFYKRSLMEIIKKIETKKKIVLGLLFLILSLPLILQFTSGEGSARFDGLSIFSDPGPSSRINELRGEHDNLNSFKDKLLHNKLTAYGPSFLGHYLDHFRPDFLFIRGDPLIRNKVPETGQFYLIEALFLVVGLLSLIKNRFEHIKLLIIWILIAPIASSMTYQTPHALRALNMVVPLTLLMGYGIISLWFMVYGLWRKIVIGLVVVIFLFEFVHYMESYYVHYPKRYPLAWEYGFKEMVEKLGKYEHLYNNVVITDRYDQPYILMLFYKKYDPLKYQPQALLSPRDKFNFGTVRSFDKFEFRPILPEEINKSDNTLFVGTDQEIPKNANIVDKVIYPNGEPAFIFAKK